MSYKAIEIDSDSSEVGETVAPKQSAGEKYKTIHEVGVKSAKLAKIDPELAYPCSSGQANTSTSTASDGCSKTVRQRSRKSQHGARRISADLQFESVAVDELGAGGSKASKKRKMEKEATVAQDKVNVAIRNLVRSEEMQELIKRIANERVRCNFLLATYQLPDMNFALNTSMDTLRNQFQERLKQRRDRGNPNSTYRAPSPASSSQKGPTKVVVKAKKP
ncbi:uncharacterized protein LOC6546837 [Drosophila erecta]|uniref:Uncharacterized protein n=1 Tax=Drosophila erecta TaxID=7220 RepID=B3NS40_DROER|nr:uncharacterized protein LOC6546837 [Drosophila erecta]XP_026836068.1 uncharacterized protein LOC6546837 [Drosophila erecta]XP_026836069.1 uncharacterized protein LOC6546837 [Drosophila erecta]EDV56342.1 uncharacterized protein Dere_GG20275 [Drosophila erecta]